MMKRSTIAIAVLLATFALPVAWPVAGPARAQQEPSAAPTAEAPAGSKDQPSISGPAKEGTPNGPATPVEKAPSDGTRKPADDQPAKAKPEGAEPEAVKPEAAPEAGKPQEVKPEVVKPEAVKPEAVKPEAAVPAAPEQSSEKPRQGVADTAATGATAAQLRFEGSNTVGEQLAPSLVKAWASRLGYTAIKTVGSVKPEESEVVAEGAERGDSLHATIHAHGTGTGLEPLLAGKADIWMASRQATAAEVAKAGTAGLGHMLEPSNEHTIALDGLLVVVHPDNPVKKLTLDQLADVFSGKITRWSAVGGRDAPIVVYSRDKKSGTFDTFKTLVLRGKPLVAAAKLYEASEGLSDDVASDPDGIGFIGIAYGRSAKPLSVATTCGLSITPSAFSIKTGEYPLARRLYMYTPEKQGPQTQKFLAFVQSLEAQDMVEKSGFIDFRPTLADRKYTGTRLDGASNALDGGQVEVRDTDVSQLEDATSGAVRLAVTFRFIAGSDRLDSLARADIDRLKEILKAPRFDGAKVVLVGFTQSLGDYGSNRAISRQRAAAVKAELEAKGVPVETAVGVGPAAPVACNTDDATRALNQRVEVWLRMPAGK